MALLFLAISVACGENNRPSHKSLITTPEGIGFYLFELLKERASIAHTEFSINSESLYIDNYDQSPAQLIVAALKGYEISLPHYWNKLLMNADSLELNDNASYINTHFSNLTDEMYRCVSVFECNSQKYTLNFDVLKWNDSQYFILRVNEKLMNYESFPKLVSDFSSNHFNLVDQVLNSNEKTIEYNHIKHPKTKVQHVKISAIKPFAQNLGFSLIKPHGLNHELKNKETAEWQLQKTSINNLYSKGAYCAILTYHLHFNETTYSVSCLAKLINEKWTVANVYPIQELELFNF